MKKYVFICILLLIGSSYSMTMSGFISFINEPNKEGELIPAENLIIVESLPDGQVIKRKIANNFDLVFIRTLKIEAILKSIKIDSYNNKIILQFKNTSGEQITNVTILETIPTQIPISISTIVSKYLFNISEQESIIRFNINKLDCNEIIKIEYIINQKDKLSQQDFDNFSFPIVLFEIEEEISCLGVLCNDYNPCTIDYCLTGECISEFEQDGKECGENSICFQGKCKENKQNFSPNLNFIIILGFCIGCLLLIVRFFQKRPKRKT